MKNKSFLMQTLPAICVLLLLILDTNTAVQGATEGVELCTKVIVPSLFPFFVVTTYLNASLLGHNIPVIHQIANILRIPKGGDSLLLLGLIGGYPVGAQLISHAYSNHNISSRTAKILLGYCSNAGPAFIFGMTGFLFSSKIVSFVLWGVHILSALITGYLLPRPVHEAINWDKNERVSLVNALQISLRICVITCGWIIIFKIILAYIDSLSFFSFSGIISLLISGLLELSNGCLQLVQLSSEPMRFILCSIFLSFGGLCVIMQTMSATEELGLGLYIPGKVIQTALSAIMAIMLSYALFPNATISFASAAYIPLLCILIFLIIKRTNKKTW